MSKDQNPFASLFPEAAKLLLTGGGKEFVQRVGVDATKQAILNVMTGHNVRTQTEPLSQQRVAVLSGAILTLFAKGCSEDPQFVSKLSDLAAKQIEKGGKSEKQVARWLIGITGKSFENVLRSDHRGLEQYLRDFDRTLTEAATKSANDFGDLNLALSLKDKTGEFNAKLGWKEIARLTTAISSQTLTIRGSEKSLYGKLFEKLILGSVLTILGFERVERTKNEKDRGVFWLSDSSGDRESDATILVKPNTFAKFDIGFIGKGNPEISKDKLSRYAREFEEGGVKSSSVTFIVVDRLPEKSEKTKEAAEKIKAELIQMSMGYWVRDLAIRLGERLDIQHELQRIDDADICPYLKEKLEQINIEEFISKITIKDIVEEVEEEELGDELDAAELLDEELAEPGATEPC